MGSQLVTRFVMEQSTNQPALIRDFLLVELPEVKKSLEKLTKANSGHQILDDWHEDMLHHLVAEVVINVHRIDLLQRHKEQNLPTLAYVVRNLLELNVWIGYCCKSKSNAWRFYEDKWKDGRGLQKTFERLVSAVPKQPNAAEIERALKSFQGTLSRTANEIGVSSLDDDYKRVSEASEELGCRTIFVTLNTVLSKFAHPTAMTVLSFIKEDAFDQIFSVIFVLGVGLAQEANKTINQYINGLGIQS